ALSDSTTPIAAALTMLLAATFLAAGPIYSDSVSLGALHRTLRDAPVHEANVEITVRSTPANLALIEPVATDEIARTFGTINHVVSAGVTSETYGLLPESEVGPVDLAVFQHIQDVELHSRLLSGRWPRSSGSILETAISDLAAERLDVEVGDVVTVVNRREPSERRSIEVSGVFTIDKPADPFWFSDELAIRGSTTSPSFTTHGPFIVSRETLLNDLTVVNARLWWRVLVGHESISVDEISWLARTLGGLNDRLDIAADQVVDTGDGTFRAFTVDSELRPILLDADESLTVTRSSVLALTMQLAILAGFALVFVAHLMVDHRRVESGLLRARGGSDAQLLRFSLVEAALLAAPAALLAPWIASKSIGLLNRLGPLAAVDLRIDPSPNATSYLLAGVVAAIGALVIAVSTSWSRMSFEQTRSDRRTENLGRGLGLDLALVVLAGLGLWQLRVHGSVISSSGRDRLDVDPILIAAPTIGLVACSILALRLIPALTRTLEIIVSRTDGAVSALSVHLGGNIDADQPWQQFGCTHVWCQPPADLQDRQLRVRMNQSDVSGKAQLETTSERMTTDRADDGDRQFPPAPHCLLSEMGDAPVRPRSAIGLASALAWVAVSHGLESGEIESGAERSSLSRQHDGAHIGAPGQRCACLDQFSEHGGVEGVQLVRAIEPNISHPVVDIDDDSARSTTVVHVRRSTSVHLRCPRTDCLFSHTPSLRCRHSLSDGVPHSEFGERQHASRKATGRPDH
ncbi:MAG: hypothetical protein P8N50_06000, partial [Actinomycetota bacterium]|nr:hypothetical protein [Actinomycetota bacterium]